MKKHILTLVNGEKIAVFDVEGEDTISYTLSTTNQKFISCLTDPAFYTFLNINVNNILYYTSIIYED